MNWTDVKTVMRLWSLRPWLYSWDIIPLEKADEYVDRRWKRWLNEAKLTRENSQIPTQELDDREMEMVERVHKIYSLVFENEKAFRKNVNDIEDIKMLIYQQSGIGDWINPLTTEAKKITAISIWIEQLPEKDDTHIILLIFVCYNYSVLLKIVDRLDGGLNAIKSRMFNETGAVADKKKDGNDAYKAHEYELAIELYTKAINLQAYNYKLYSNRAQCYIYNKKYSAAACDGLRCVTIEPLWDKGWQRYAQGLYNMGKYIQAWQVNQKGRELCPKNIERLESQAEEFKKHEAIASYIAANRLPNKKKQKAAKVNGYGPPASLLNPEGKAAKNADVNDLPPLVSDEEDSEPPSPEKPPASLTTKKPTVAEKLVTDKKSGSKKPETKTVSINTDIKAVKLDRPPTVISKESQKPQKAKKSTNNNNTKARGKKDMKQDTVYSMSGEALRTRDLLAQASCALVDKRMRNAVTLFTQAMAMLDTVTQCEIGYHDDQMAVVIYALGWSNINIGGEKELEDGLAHFNSILMRYQTIVFPLAYLGIGLTYSKWNRYKSAVDPLSKGLRIARTHDLNQVYAWPESLVCIEESKKDKLLELFEELLIQCRMPPKPSAICRYNDCAHYQLEIYPNDPDFKGYVEMTCLAQCKVAYHQDCWKKSKTASNKEILSRPCFTPDCTAPMKNIIIYDHTGEKADEKENQIPKKEPGPRKPRVKMAASSQIKMKRKQDRKEVRRQKREEERRKKEEAGALDELLDKVENAANQEVKAAPEVDLNSCTKIMPKKEDENRDDDSKKLKKKKKGHQKAVYRLDLMPPESGPPTPQHESSPSPMFGSFGALDDFEELAGYPGLDANQPFAVPAHLAAEVAQIEDRTSSESRKSSVSVASRSSSPAVSEPTEREKEIDEANKKKAIRDSLFPFFKNILQDLGPVQIDGPELTSHLSQLPEYTLNIIESEGGLVKFLNKSTIFTIIDDFVGISKDKIKIKKAATKRKLELRKGGGASEKSKKHTAGAIPPHLKPAAVSIPTANGAAAAAAAGESDRESIASTDTGCSESLELGSTSSRTSSGKNRSSSLTSSGASAKSSPWQLPSTNHHQEFHSTEVAARSADMAFQVASPSSSPKVGSVEVVNQYRLGANRLLAAVELGRLALRVNLRLGVEVRFLYGWTLTSGLENTDAETCQVSARLLNDAIQKVTSVSSVVYNTNGAEVYFFGLGQNSVDGERAQWVTGPEVGRNHGIVIALALDHVDMGSVKTESLDHMAVETLLAVKAAADTVCSISDRFKASLEIKQALLPIFTSMGRCVAADDPETLALIIKPIPKPKPPPGLSINTMSPVSTPSPLSGINSPIARPSSITEIPSHNKPIQNSNPPTPQYLFNSLVPPLSAAASVPSTTSFSYHTSTSFPSLNSSAGSLNFNASALSSFDSTSAINTTAVQSGFTNLAAQAAFNNTAASAASSLTGLASSGSSSRNDSGASSPFNVNASQNSLGSSIWGSSSQEGYGSNALYGLNDPLKVAAQERRQQELELQAAKNQAKEYSQIIEKLQAQMGQVNEQLASVTADSSTHKQHVLSQTEQIKAMEKRIRDMADRENLWLTEIKKAKEENSQLRLELEKQKQSSEEALKEAKKSIEELIGKAQRERDLRVATETQYEEFLQERTEAYNALEIKQRDEKHRAENAEVSLLQLKLEVGLQIVDRSAKEAELFIGKIRAQATQFGDQAIPAEYRLAEEAWKSTLDKIKATREKATAAFEDQKNRVRGGQRLDTLPTLDIPRPPPAPDMPQLRAPPALMSQPHKVTGNGDSTSRSPFEVTTNGKKTPPTASSPAPTAANFALKAQQPMTAAAAVAKMAAAQQAVNKPTARPPGFSAVAAAGLPAKQSAAAKPAAKLTPTKQAAARPKNSFERIVDIIQSKFPMFDRSKISSFLQQLRQSRNGSLSGMKMEDVLSSVECYIHQEQVKKGYGAANGAGLSSIGGLDPVSLNVSNDEDQCSICLEDLTAGNTRELDCRHIYHTSCIRKWLTEKSTCPLCNKHALLPDEYPALC